MLRAIHLRTGLIALALAVALVAAAAGCGSGDDKATTTTTTSVTTTTVEETTTVADPSGDRAEIQIQPVLSSGPCPTPPTTGTDPTTPGASVGETTATTLPADGSLPTVDGRFCYKVGPSVGDGNDLQDATVSRNGDTWQVLARPSDDSAADLNKAFDACFAGATTCPAGEGGHGYVAFIWKERVLLAPAVSVEGLADGPILMASGLDERTARDLAAVINFG
jgi:hypothetical protein